MQASAGAKTHGVPNRKLKHCADSKNNLKKEAVNRDQRRSTADSFPGCGTSFRLVVQYQTSRRRLEAETDLSLDNTAPKGVSRDTESAIRRRHSLRASRGVDHDGADILVCERSQVELIEQIVKVGAQIDSGVFAQNAHAR